MILKQHMTVLHLLLSLSLWDTDELESLTDCFGNLHLLQELSVGNCQFEISSNKPKP